MATTGEIYNELVQKLESLYTGEEASAIVRLLMQDVMGVDRMKFQFEKVNDLDSKSEKAIRQAFIKIKDGQPVQQVIGKVYFQDCHLRVNPHVLIPRQETEELTQIVINEIKSVNEPFILDVGTGSGCIAIALYKHLKEASVTALDVSQEALELARINAIANNAYIDFQNIDILDEENWKRLGEFDAIVSNPPYIPENEKDAMHINVVMHEPHLALFVPGNDPLLFYRKIGEMGLKRLCRNGRIFFETHMDYGKEVAKLLEKQGYKNVKLSKDLSGRDRFVRAEI